MSANSQRSIGSFKTLVQRTVSITGSVIVWPLVGTGMLARPWVVVRLPPDPEELTLKEMKIVSVAGVFRSHWASTVTVQPEAVPGVDVLSEAELVSPEPKTLMSTPQVVVLPAGWSLM